MQIGMVGLGRMGANMVRRLMKHTHECIAYDSAQEKVEALAVEGPIPASSLAELIEKLTKPKAVWPMLPAGEPTETTIKQLASIVPSGSTIVDGGNSFYKDDVSRDQML